MNQNIIDSAKIYGKGECDVSTNDKAEECEVSNNEVEECEVSNNEVKECQLDNNEAEENRSSGKDFL